MSVVPEGCGLKPLSKLPRPRELASWADSRFEAVALLESNELVGEKSRYTIVAYGAERVVEEGDPGRSYEALSTLTRTSRCTSIPCNDMALGVVGFEAVAEAEPWLASRLKRHSWPVTLAFKPEAIIVYDRLLGRALACPEDAELGSSRPGAWVRARGPIYETGRREFESWVREALGLIASGEFIQVVLSRVERYEYRGDPLALYERLATLNPSPYMFYIRVGSRWIAGSSPELLLRMENGRLETHPIAGTRPRGATPEEDLELEKELISDEKELAEHIMLVDLARNDLGRYSVPGSVRVVKLMDVEKYSSVQHIVSRVESLALPGVDYPTILKAVNPAGTVSGAPKPRALETILALEDEARGPYAGAVGMFSGFAGETAIVIRSLWSLEEGVVETRAGAGIVYDSKPEREYMETVYKLAAVRRALGVGVGKPWATTP